MSNGVVEELKKLGEAGGGEGREGDWSLGRPWGAGRYTGGGRSHVGGQAGPAEGPTQ